MRGKKDWDVLTDPPPDLALEVDITSSSLDRMSIYAAACKYPKSGITTGPPSRSCISDQRTSHKEKAKSLAFPELPLKEFARFLRDLGSTDEIQLIHEFTDWVRANMAQKKNGQAARKNGKKVPLTPKSDLLS